MEKKDYDFSGWATKNNIKCSDGRVIRKDAFIGNDGGRVPLVWNHDHKDSDSVLGHADLENREEGVYAYCSFNDTAKAQNAKKMVEHGDIRSLSIYANQLRQNGDDVIHGKIREVSLVLAGANLGAYIDTVIAHSEDCDEEARIYHPYDEDLVISHGCCGGGNNDDKKKELEHAKDDAPVDDKNNKGEIEKMPEDNKEKTVQDVIDGMTEEQQKVVEFLLAEAVKAAEETKKENMEDNNNMKHNAFDSEENTNFLSHADIEAIVDDAKRSGSMKDAFNAYVINNFENGDELAHSITNISNLFPEVQNVNNAPLPIARNMDWVKVVMGEVHHTPFSRIKSTAANLTADEARAKGYVKAAQKAEEVLIALKRTTTPQTVYKLQKIDRDDVLDITDFDVVAWIKVEMRAMLDEELARAFLIGDGRSAASADKIIATNIRPILGDDSVYTIAKTLERAVDDTEYTFAKKFIREAVKSRKDYKGSGNPTLFCTEELLTDMLLIEDTNGRVIYDTEEKLATALRVKKIISVPVMENVVRTSGGYDYKCMGVIVNLADYNVGADKGGQVTLFDDFDINYNKMEYLIETRCSGALVVPYSAITFEEKYTHVEG